MGGDKTAPEHQNGDTPCNPFPTDVYYLGNLVRGYYMKVRVCVCDREAVLILPYGPEISRFRVYGIARRGHGPRGPNEASFEGRGRHSFLPDRGPTQYMETTLTDSPPR
jgi:hypothetical protein